MNKFRTSQIGSFCLTIILIAGSPAHGDWTNNVLLGLEEAGFQFTGGPNPLSNGGDVQITRNFQGETLDFGAMELSLNGPITTNFAYSNRIIRTVDMSFSTLGQPLQYVYNADTGGQQVTVAGSFALDGNLSINQFGFYDLSFDLSSRQDIFQEGRFRNADGEEQDFDLGPVDVSGNIFADMLASVFDPFFDATNTVNIFANFSGRTEREVKLENAARRLEAKLASGQQLTSHEVSAFMTDSLEAQVHGDRVPSMAFLDLSYGSSITGSGSGGGPIPEPSTLVLLGCIGVGMALARCKPMSYNRIRSSRSR